MAGIFKAYDVRGLYPDELDDVTAEKIGYSFVQLLGAERIVVGRDMRLSSPALASAFCKGAAAAGAEVSDAGMTSTPLLYHCIIDGTFDGGAMITASHLPGKSNGIKLSRERAVPLSGDEGLPALESLVTTMPAGKHTGGTKAGGSCRPTDMIAGYIDRMAGFAKARKKLRIVADAGDGMAGPELIRLDGRLGKWQILPMFPEPDGLFPHHGSNPFLPGMTQDAERRIVSEGADFGVAFDGDADRCIFIDDKGLRVPADLATALIAEFFLEEHPGETILYDLRSSRIVPETIRKFGGRPVRSRVGHAFIKDLMRRENGVFAGELSGHYYFRDTGFCDNGIFAMIQMANLLSLRDEPLSKLILPLRKYASTGELNMRVTRRDEIMKALGSAFSDGEQDQLDGLTVSYPTWWFNLRSSNTEPLIRLNLEADNRALMDRKLAEVEVIIRGTDPGCCCE